MEFVNKRNREELDNDFIRQEPQKERKEDLIGKEKYKMSLVEFFSKK
jgi:hypothetical protein